MMSFLLILFLWNIFFLIFLTMKIFVSFLGIFFTEIVFLKIFFVLIFSLGNFSFENFVLRDIFLRRFFFSEKKFFNENFIIVNTNSRETTIKNTEEYSASTTTRNRSIGFWHKNSHTLKFSNQPNSSNITLRSKFSWSHNFLNSTPITYNMSHNKTNCFSHYIFTCVCR